MDRKNHLASNFLFLALAAVKYSAVKKIRTPIPEKTRKAILKEFHNKCAFGHGNPPAPELHHIDEDPSNHDHSNLLPLCPNCHSLKLNPRIISVFRQYKRHEILSVEFEQLLNKAAFIFDLSAMDYFPHCFAPGEDLVAFVRQLRKGKYYAPKIDKLIRDTEQDDLTLEELEEFEKNRRKAILTLLVELLPYQGWKPVAHLRTNFD